MKILPLIPNQRFVFLSFFTFLLFVHPSSNSTILSCLSPKEGTSSGNESFPLLTYSHTSENLTSLAKLESVQYWEYEEFVHGKEISNPPQTKLDIWLLCNHTKPVKFVSNTNPAEEQKIKILAYTYRQARNYSDPSTERFISLVRLQVDPEHTSPIVYICEDIQDPCNSRIVVTTLNETTESYVLRNYYYSESELNPVIAKFVRERYDTETLNLANNDTCPMRLTLYYMYSENEQGELLYDWHEHQDTAAVLVLPSFTIVRENDYRLVPSLGEQCVTRSHFNIAETNRSIVCPDCKSYDFYTGKGYPHVVFYNRAADGNRRVFHIYFDLKMQTLRYISEPSENEDLTAIYFGENDNCESEILDDLGSPPEFFRGETIKLKCVGSAAKFSAGVFLLWGFLGETEKPFEEAIPFNDDDSCVNQITGGGIFRTIELNISRELLDSKNASSLNITCLFPVWNTTEWVSRSTQVLLKESHYPSGKLIQSNSEIANNSKISVNLGGDLTISCVATGGPIPQVKFGPKNKVLQHNVSLFTSKSEVKVTLKLENVDHTYGGNTSYSCFINNVLGETEIFFQVEVVTGLSGYEKSLIIGLCVVSAIFATVGAFLLVKYRREQVDFQRKTAEAIRKFHEGFKDTKGIGFAANAEHQAYELALTHWDLGGTMLGKGAFGTVHKGCIRQGQRVTIVAVKTVNAPKDVLEFESSLKELLIMAYIGKHPHIISLIATCTDNMAKRSLILATEYCANGDLLSYLRKNKKFFCKDGKSSVLPQNETDDQSAGYMNIMEEDDKFYSLIDLHIWSMQIADGMAFLESKKVLHGDLAARNVLLTKSKIAKISDFGLSRQLTDDDNYTKQTYCPLPWKWMALESLQYRVFSSKSDVWSYGITLHEIYTLGEEPWAYLEWTTEFVDELEHGRRLAMPKFATQEIYEKVMLESWRNNPEDRPSFEDIKKMFVSVVPQAAILAEVK